MGATSQKGAYIK